MFLTDRLHPLPARLALRYPHPVRLGQVPSPVGFPDFLSYLAATQGFTNDTRNYASYPLYFVPGPTDVKVDYSDGPLGGATTRYGFHRFAMSLDASGQPESTSIGHLVEVWNEVLTAFQVSPYWAAWQAARGATEVPTTTPPPAGADLAQITHVVLPAAAMPAGAQFAIQVTVLNVGTVTWSTGYTIIVQAPPGTPTSAPQGFALLPSALAPGQSATVTVTLWAPTQTGTYAYAVGLYNPTSARVSELVTVGIVVIPATAGSSVVSTTTAGYVSAQEFGTFVQAMLDRQQQEQGAIAAMQAGAAQQYSPTYVGQPGPPTVSPAAQQAGAQPVVIQPAVAAAGFLGLPWWVWLLGVALVGGGVYYRFYRPAVRRRRAARQPVGGTTVTVRPRQGRPRRRHVIRRRTR